MGRDGVLDGKNGYIISEKRMDMREKWLLKDNYRKRISAL